MSTTLAKPAEVSRTWYILDAEGKTLGRLCTEAAMILRGKKKPTYTPFLDTGEYVIVINAEQVKVTGKKLEEKIYWHHTGWIGGQKKTTLKRMLQIHPERVVEHAVKGMLPKGPLGRQMYRKLHVYAGPEHPHAAQKPEEMKIG